jgi:hypothetical protein
MGFKNSRTERGINTRNPKTKRIWLMKAKPLYLVYFIGSRWRVLFLAQKSVTRRKRIW